MAAQYLVQECIWSDQLRVQAAECLYYEKLSLGSSAGSSQQTTSSGSSLVNEIARARKHIQKSLDEPAGDDSSAPSGDVIKRLNALEEENKQLNAAITDLRAIVSKVEKLESRLAALERGSSGQPAAAAPAAKEESEEDDDDDVDLFGSDDEADEEAERIKQERLAAYAAKKSKKPALVAKSNVILDVKPWDDETDMEEMEKLVRSIEMDGLLWGTSKLQPLAYGIKKLVIATVIEDDKVSVDLLEEKICEFEDYVQSVDIAAFNKI